MNRELIERLRTEADLCRNETAVDVANLLDEAADALSAQAGVVDESEACEQAQINLYGCVYGNQNTDMKREAFCRGWQARASLQPTAQAGVVDGGALADMDKAMKCLYIAVEESVADDINQRWARLRASLQPAVPEGVVPLQMRVYCWLGKHRDKMPPELVESLQDLLGPLAAAQEGKV